jgi:hypothetical protein
MDLQVTRDLLQQKLQSLCEEEERINQDLQSHFAQLLGKTVRTPGTPSNPLQFEHFNLTSDLNKIKNFAPVYESIHQNTKKLATQVDECNALSERLSQMVRKLDVKQMRAQKALACTENILNLKDCKHKLLQAIEHKDLTAAVSCIKQVHDIDEKAAKTSEDYEVIVEKEKEVKELVRNEFQSAITESNTNAVMQLCPLLQTLGLETEARDNFLSYMESKVFIAVSADAAAVEGATDPATAYAQALSSVFNSTCLIIQQYLPMVIQGLENSLGDVHFIRRLHKRCEQEAGLVLKRYMKYRGVKEMIGNLKSGNIQSSSATVSTQNAPNTSGGSSGSTANTLAELHITMNELALLVQYCCKYRKYLRNVCQGAENKVRSSSSTAIIVFSGPLEFDRMVDELINKYYMEGEQFLMKMGTTNVLPKLNDLSVSESAHKTMRLDECFFILQKCGLRSIASHNIHAACACLTVISDLISNDLLNQGMEMITDSINKIVVIIQDHVSRYRKRMASDENNTADHVSHSSSSSNLSFGLSKGLSSAMSLASTIAGSSGATTDGGMNYNSSANNPSAHDILFHEDGTFTIPLLHNNPNDPWGSANYLQAFNIIELCIRYTERLNKDLYEASQNVFMTEEDEIEHAASKQQNVTGKFSRGGKSGGNKPMLPATEFDKVKLCKENFDNIKSTYSNVRDICSNYFFLFIYFYFVHFLTGVKTGR